MNPTPDWLRKILEAAKQHIPKDFVGQIHINCFKGGISNTTVQQSYKEVDQ